uniref:Hpt domain-containing protein n=1 Tax=uncultured Polaribacter sp. TaxID=174711 RepID=UPI00261A7EE3|nr:Hpt domain-containing protein [uncultured Polaribacter sp.]
MEIESVLESNVVDLTSLKTFFASDKDALIQIIQVYISDTEPRIKTLEESLTNIDYTEIKSISHFLKSSFSLMGINCSEEIAELEKMADRKEKDSLIKEKLNYIIPICKESIVEYKIILQKLEAL